MSEDRSRLSGGDGVQHAQETSARLGAPPEDRDRDESGELELLCRACSEPEYMRHLGSLVPREPSQPVSWNGPTRSVGEGWQSWAGELGVGDRGRGGGGGAPPACFPGGVGRLARLARCGTRRRVPGRGYRPALAAPGGVRGAGPRWQSRRDLHPHRFREVAGLPDASARRAAGTQGGSRQGIRAAPPHRAVPGAHQGSGSRPSPGRRGPGPGIGADQCPRRRLRRGRAAIRPRTRQPGAHQPRHAALLRAAEPSPLVGTAGRVALRHHRRGPSLPGGFRGACRAGAAAAATPRRRPRRRPDQPAQLRHCTERRRLRGRPDR